MYTFAIQKTIYRDLKQWLSNFNQTFLKLLLSLVYTGQINKTCFLTLTFTDKFDQTQKALNPYE